MNANVIRELKEEDDSFSSDDDQHDQDQEKGSVPMDKSVPKAMVDGISRKASFSVSRGMR